MIMYKRRRYMARLDVVAIENLVYALDLLMYGQVKRRLLWVYDEGYVFAKLLERDQDHEQ